MHRMLGGERVAARIWLPGMALVPIRFVPQPCHRTFQRPGIVRAVMAPALRNGTTRPPPVLEVEGRTTTR